ncbi:hypothetical protein ACFLTH_02745 [Bacteroidota bacterium]
MKKIIFTSFFLIWSSSLFAQFDISGGMGISFVNNSSLTDYLNIYFPSSSELGSFNSSVEFFIEGDYTLSEDFQLGVEYAYQIFSHNTQTGNSGTYDLSYGHHKPSIVGYYVVSGAGYKFKFGGGVGYRIISLDEQIFATTNYSASGLGFLLRAQGNTLLSGDLYVNVGLDLRYDLPGEPKNGNQYIVDNTINENINVNSLSVGIRVGVSYFIK